MPNERRTYRAPHPSAPDNGNKARDMGPNRDQLRDQCARLLVVLLVVALLMLGTWVIDLRARLSALERTLDEPRRETWSID